MIICTVIVNAPPTLSPPPVMMPPAHNIGGLSPSERRRERPTTNLDNLVERQIIDLLREQQKKLGASVGDLVGAWLGPWPGALLGASVVASG